jgi:alpha-L-fucosidase
MQNKSLPQVEELTKRYPELFLVWFDAAGFIPEETSFDFYRRIYQNAPNTLVSSRLSSDGLPRNLGDYQSAGDNHIPDPSEFENPYWETCGTMNNSWGFNSYDHDWKYPVEVLSWLVDVVSRGGNYLLNVGPDGNGEIPAESGRILRDVGKWMKVNGEAIYGTRAWTTFREGPTVLTRKGTRQRAQDGFTAEFTAEDIWFTKKGSTVYAIGLMHPVDNKILIRSLRDADVAAVRMLGTDQPVSWESTPDGLIVVLPTTTSNIGYALGVDLK